MRTEGYKRILDRYREEGRFRRIPQCIGPDATDLSSNDYMGLAHRYFEEYADDMIEISDAFCMSSSASRLLCGDQDSFNSLERELEKAYGRPALLFNSGYHANTGLISALAIPSTLFFVDKLAHASILDGLAIGRAEFKRFPHNNVAKLSRLVEKESDRYDRIIIVTESLFSMGGDEAPMEELVSIRERNEKILLYIDEAHAFGVRGKKGLGEKVDIVVGTFGKTGASAGAFCVCDETMKEYFINSSRSFIFSTALPPAVAEWSRLMFRQLLYMEKERAEFKERCGWFRKETERITGEQTGSTSQIVPLKAGSAERAIRISEALRERGFIGLPIRRPTVPEGEEMVRLSLRADISRERLGELLETIKKIYRK